MHRAPLASALTVLAVTSTLAQPADRPRAPGSPGPAVPGMNAAPGAREENRSTGAPRQTGSNAADQAFLARAAQSSLAEIELARLAEQNAVSPSVREFARRMITDHEQMSRSLQALAEGGGSAADQLDAGHREVRDALARLSGAAFDIEYLRQQVQAHQRLATLLQYVIGSGTDLQVKRVASDSLPKVLTHLAVAQQLLDQMSMQNPQIAGAPPRSVSGMPTLQTPRANGN
jgi:putative membrane protein